jgi:hypothetical protein
METKINFIETQTFLAKKKLKKYKVQSKFMIIRKINFFLQT